jgi:hypothetical protein
VTRQTIALDGGDYLDSPLADFEGGVNGVFEDAVVIHTGVTMANFPKIARTILRYF